MFVTIFQIHGFRNSTYLLLCAVKECCACIWQGEKDSFPCLFYFVFERMMWSEYVQMYIFRSIYTFMTTKNFTSRSVQSHQVGYKNDIFHGNIFFFFYWKRNIEIKKPVCQSWNTESQVYLTLKMNFNFDLKNKFTPSPVWNSGFS